MYSNEEVLIKITRKLEDNNIIFEINRNNKSIDLFFDTEHKMVCRIYVLEIEITFLGTGLSFNLQEGKVQDDAMIDDAINHILRILTIDLFVEETYKKSKLCLVRHFHYIDSKKQYCSDYHINTWVHLFPFKKDIRINCYRYKKGDNDKLGIFLLLENSINKI